MRRAVQALAVLAAAEAAWLAAQGEWAWGAACAVAVLLSLWVLQPAPKATLLPRRARRGERSWRASFVLPCSDPFVRGLRDVLEEAELVDRFAMTHSPAEDRALVAVDVIARDEAEARLAIAEALEPTGLVFEDLQVYDRLGDLGIAR